MRESTLSALVLLTFATMAVSAAPPAADATDGTATLTYDAGPAAGRIVTPARVRGGVRFGVQAASGTITAAGRKVAVAARLKGSSVYFAVDRNGDGSLAASEYVRYVKNKAVRISLAPPDGPACAIRFADLDIRVRNKAVYYMAGTYSIISCMSGTVNGQQVRIFDDNLDGTFTQDGKDAIALGRSVVAMPLTKTHQIGKDICNVTVAADGTTIEGEARSSVELGVVVAPISPRLLKSLVLIGREGAYDVTVSGKTGLPAGKYRLAFGVLSSGNRTMPFVPGRENTTYPITGGMINRLRIGPPAELRFTPVVSGEKITINPYTLSIVGSGGEKYLASTKDLGRPTVYLVAGTRTVVQKRMEYG